MEKAIKFYQLPNDTCSCRDENGDTTKIGRKYKQYYEKLKSGKSGDESLREMGIMRTCCRLKLLCLSTDVMLDRSKERFMETTIYVCRSVCRTRCRVYI